MLLYGVVECINAIKIHQANKVREAARKATEQKQQELQTPKIGQSDPVQEVVEKDAQAD